MGSTTEENGFVRGDIRQTAWCVSRPRLVARWPSTLRSVRYTKSLFLRSYACIQASKKRHKQVRIASKMIEEEARAPSVRAKKVFDNGGEDRRGWAEEYIHS